jgi:hypothetical protein
LDVEAHAASEPSSTDADARETDTSIEPEGGSVVDAASDTSDACRSPSPTKRRRSSRRSRASDADDVGIRAASPVKGRARQDTPLPRGRECVTPLPGGFHAQLLFLLPLAFPIL